MDVVAKMLFGQKFSSALENISSNRNIGHCLEYHTEPLTIALGNTWMLRDHDFTHPYQNRI